MFFCSLPSLSQERILLSFLAKEKQPRLRYNRMPETTINVSLNIFWIKNKDKRERSSVSHKTSSLEGHLQALPKLALVQFLGLVIFPLLHWAQAPVRSCQVCWGSSSLQWEGAGVCCSSAGVSCHGHPGHLFKDNWDMSVQMTNKHSDTKIDGFC